MSWEEHLMNKEIYPIVAIMALFIVIVWQPVASPDGSEGHIIEAWDEIVGTPADEITIHVHIQDDEDEFWADEYRVYIYSEDGTELDYEPDTYWKNLDGQDYWFLVSSDLDPLWDIYDLGNQYRIVLMEQHDGVQDELWMDTPSPLKTVINIPSTGEVLQTITFDGSGSYAGGLTSYITKYKWDFGDGSSTQEIDTSLILHEVEDVYHTYWSEDDYIVTLTVWDNNGNSNYATAPIRISNKYGGSGLLSDEKTELQKLAIQYSPLLYVHPLADHNCPINISQFLAYSTLKEEKELVTDPIIVEWPSINDLMTFSGNQYYLDEIGWCADPAQHPDLAEDPTVYVHYRKENGLFFLQYYFFYYYNNGFNNHEGDIEMIQISFDSEYTPLTSTYSQHTDTFDFNWGEKRYWHNVEKYIDENDDLTSHPLVYVSSGVGIDSDDNSHANYFYKGDGPLSDNTDGCTEVILHGDFNTGVYRSYEVVFLPNLEDDLTEQYGWLQFSGKWGETSINFFSGVPGPAFCDFDNEGIGDGFKYFKWMDPYKFEMGRFYDGSHNEIPFEYPTIDVNDKSVGMENAVVLEAYLRDESQNPLDDKRLSFYVDEEFQDNGQTNSDGYASIIYHDTTVLGDHEIQVVFKGQNEDDPDYAWCDKKATLTISADDQTGEGASPFITSSLEVIQSSPFYVGNTLTAQFTIENKGTAPITFDVLTVGGRDPDYQVADFTFKYDIALDPGESYMYQGSLTLTKAGDYHFFCAYKTPDGGNWNTAIPTEDGVSNVLDIPSTYTDEEDPFEIPGLKEIPEVPGFEIIIVICAVALILFWKQNWKK